VQNTFNVKRLIDPILTFNVTVQLSEQWMKGMLAAMRVGVYDFSGYYEVCYMGSEIENPGSPSFFSLCSSCL